MRWSVRAATSRAAGILTLAVLMVAGLCAQAAAQAPGEAAGPELVLRIVTDPRWMDIGDDGRSLFIRTREGDIQVWDTDSQRLWTTYHMPETEISLPVLATQALLFAYADWPDLKVHVRDALTRQELFALVPPPRHGIVPVAMSPDGQTLAANGGIYRTSTGEKLDAGLPSSAGAVVLDNARILTGDWNGAVTLRYIGGGSRELRGSLKAPARQGDFPVPTLSEAHPRVSDVAMSHGTYAACGRECGAYLWRDGSDTPVELVPAHGPRGSDHFSPHPAAAELPPPEEDPVLVALGQRNNRAVVAQFDGTLRVWDLTTDTQLGAWRWPAGYLDRLGTVRVLRYTRGDRLVAVGIADGLTSVWHPGVNPGPRALAPTAKPHGLMPIIVGFQADGHLTALQIPPVVRPGVGGSQAALREAALHAPIPLHRVTWSSAGVTAGVTGCEIRFYEPWTLSIPDMVMFNCVREEGLAGSCRTRSLRDGSLIASVPVSEHWLISSIATDASCEFMAIRRHKQVQLVRLRDGQEVASFALNPDGGGDVLGAVLSGDGSTLAVRTDKILILSARTGAELGRLEGREIRNSGAMALSTTGRRVALADGQVIRVYAVASGQNFEVRDLGEITPLCFSPDGRFLAAGGAGGQVTVWDAADGSVLSDMRAHLGEVTSLAFSPDGSAIVSAGWDGKIVVADIASGKRLADLLLLSGPGVEENGWLAIAPDGHYDGSPGAIDACIRFRFGEALVGAGTFPERHVEGLLASVLAQIGAN